MKNGSGPANFMRAFCTMLGNFLASKFTAHMERVEAVLPFAKLLSKRFDKRLQSVEGKYFW